MSFVSNGGKFKLYTVLNGLLFSAPAQPRISFERAIQDVDSCNETISMSDILHDYFSNNENIYFGVHFESVAVEIQQLFLGGAISIADSVLCR
jgi:hypothetical protein